MALQDVLLDELRDMYSVENQLVKATPKFAKGVEDSDLKRLFKEHAEETKGQVQRLREIFEHLGKKPTGKHCEGMEGVVKEGLEALEEETEGASYDSGILGAALRTEHYEIAGYKVSLAMAKALGLKEIADLLKQNLSEEESMAKNLQAAAKDIFKRATKEEEENEDAEPESKKSAKDKESERKSKQDEQQASVAEKKGKEKAGKKARKSEETEADADEGDAQQS